MTPKEYLSQIIHIDDVIASKMDIMRDLKSKIYGISKTLSQDRIQNTNKVDFTDKIVKLVDLEDEINRLVDDLIERKRKVTLEISKVEDCTYQAILTKRYLNGMDLKDISNELYASYSHVRKLHGYALEEFKRKNIEIFKVDTK